MRCGIIGLYDIHNVGCSTTGMFRILDIRMFGMSGIKLWDVWDVRCEMCNVC